MAPRHPAQARPSERRPAPPGRPRGPEGLSRRQLLGLLAGVLTGASLGRLQGPLWAASAAAAPGAATSAADWKKARSDLGSLYPFIQAQADLSPLSLSYLGGDFPDLSDWQRRLRTRIGELLHYQPPQPELEPQVLQSHQGEEFTRHQVSFQSSPGCRVPGYLLVPRGAPPPRPGVLVLHDHGGFYYFGKEKVVGLPEERPVLTLHKRRYYGGRSLADELARRGYVVLVIDAFYFGERRLITESEAAVAPGSITDGDIRTLNRRNAETEDLVARALLAAGVTWMGIMLWDDRRSLDYLAARPEVDPERLACVGLSVGGYRSLFLAALDERIKAAVDVGWMTRLAPVLRKHVGNTLGHSTLIPGLYHYLDLPEVALAVAPRAFLCINGTQDPLFPPEAVRAAHADIARGFAQVGSADRFRSILYPGPHEFNAEMQEEAWTWLRRGL